MPTLIDGSNNIVTSNTTWGDGISLIVTVSSFVESPATLHLDVPSLAAITGAGSIFVRPGASVSINGPTGLRTITIPAGQLYTLKA